MLSKTKIKSNTRRKTSEELVETIRLAAKNPNWLPIAKTLSRSRRNYSAINLKDIDKNSAEGDTIIIPGKILSQGDITKKIRLCALSISKEARGKLKNTKSEFFHLMNEIKNNPKAEGIKILK